MKYSDYSGSLLLLPVSPANQSWPWASVWWRRRDNRGSASWNVNVGLDGETWSRGSKPSSDGNTRGSGPEERAARVCPVTMTTDTHHVPRQGNPHVILKSKLSVFMLIRLKPVRLGESSEAAQTKRSSFSSRWFKQDMLCCFFLPLLTPFHGLGHCSPLTFTWF